MKKMTSKHDKLNMKFMNKFKGVESIIINYEYKNKKKTKVLGEIDGFCFRRNRLSKTAYLIETKSSVNPKTRMKAIFQMARANRLFIPKYEKYNDVYFSKVVCLYVNPEGVKCEGIYRK